MKRVKAEPCMCRDEEEHFGNGRQSTVAQLVKTPDLSNFMRLCAISSFKVMVAGPYPDNAMRARSHEASRLDNTYASNT